MVLGLVAREQGIPWAFAVGAGIALLGAAWTVRLALTPDVVRSERYSARFG